MGGPRERRWRSKQRLALVVWGLGVGLAPLPGRPGQLGVGRTLPLRLEVGPCMAAGWGESPEPDVLALILSPSSSDEEPD